MARDVKANIMRDYVDEHDYVPKQDYVRVYRVLKIFKSFDQEVRRLLDLGCYSGDFALRIKRACNASEVFGIDNHEERLGLARQKGLKTFKLNIDKEPYPFQDDYFDAIFAGEVLEHLDDPDHFFEETFRVLRRKGILVITTPNFASWYNRTALMLGFQPFQLDNSYRGADAGKIVKGRKYSVDIQGRHTKLYTRRALTELLELFGFSVIASFGYPYPLEGKRYVLFNSVDRLMEYLGAGAGIIVACSKN